MIIIYILCGILAGGLVYYCCEQKRRKNLQSTAQQLTSAQATLNELLSRRKELVQQNENLHEAIIQAQQQQSTLQTSIEAEEKRLTFDIPLLKQAQEAQKQQIIKQHQQEIAEYRESVGRTVRSFQREIDDMQAKYKAIIDVLRENEDDDITHRLQIPMEARADIEFLLNDVAAHLKNPNIIYKLIWSEYIQTPAAELLNHILPNKDCAGIYKITNCADKKCYIGRSTSVRKRLQEHIKSAIGIENIAAQRVHTVMREQGLWNFRFELIEACDKNQLGEREKYYIDFFNAQGYGYNQISGSAYRDKGDN